MTETRPWHRVYGSVPVTLEYPEVTLYEALAETALPTSPQGVIAFYAAVRLGGPTWARCST